MPKGRRHKGSKDGNCLVFGELVNVIVYDIFEPNLDGRVPILCFVLRVGLDFEHDRPTNNTIVLAIFAVAQTRNVDCRLSQVPRWVKLNPVEETDDVDGDKLSNQRVSFVGFVPDDPFMIKDWHNNSCDCWKDQTLDQNSDCIFGRELDVLILLSEVDKVEKSFEGESRSDQETGEKEAIREEL